VTAYLLERAWVDGAVHDEVRVEIEGGRFVSVELGVGSQNLSAVPSPDKFRFPRSTGEIPPPQNVAAIRFTAALATEESSGSLAGEETTVTTLRYSPFRTIPTSVARSSSATR
jgi:hypothetical protein